MQTATMKSRMAIDRCHCIMAAVEETAIREDGGIDSAVPGRSLPIRWRTAMTTLLLKSLMAIQMEMECRVQTRLELVAAVRSARWDCLDLV